MYDLKKMGIIGVVIGVGVVVFLNIIVVVILEVL